MSVTDPEIKIRGSIVLSQILFFTSFSLLRYNDLIHRNIRIALIIVMFVILTGLIFWSVLISKKQFLNCVLYGVSMLFLFETMKFIEYKLNLLPKYNEHPIASLVVSFILLFIYFGFIYFASILMKKQKNK